MGSGAEDVLKITRIPAHDGVPEAAGLDVLGADSLDSRPGVDSAKLLKLSAKASRAILLDMQANPEKKGDANDGGYTKEMIKRRKRVYAILVMNTMGHTWLYRELPKDPCWAFAALCNHFDPVSAVSTKALIQKFGKFSIADKEHKGNFTRYATNFAKLVKDLLKTQRST